MNKAFCITAVVFFLLAFTSLANSEPSPGQTWTEPKTGMEFAWVPGGCFQMGCASWDNNCSGDERPPHEVCVDGFWMGRFEVTQGQWTKVMEDNPSYNVDEDFPVEQVPWDAMREFIRKLGPYYRLPTEAEWEYACRSGGKLEKYSGGEDVERLAWYGGAGGNSGGGPHPVGTKAPNGLGLHDMSGNIWEWCSDYYDKDYYAKSPRNNPENTTGGGERVLRGGSWLYRPGDVRCTIRFHLDPDHAVMMCNGFRLVREP